MKKVYAVLAGVLGFMGVLSSQAYAALDLSGISVNTADYETIATWVIAALVLFWGIKKGITLIR